ncbi:MAG: hypothetical protein KF845_07015 [Cyclobacteriaceae bacterium]|nr:hypothetical protein [Cyclobacteriaceae bacterium]
MNSLSFNPITDWLLVVPALTLVFLLLVWIEIQRKEKKLLWRLAALALIAISLAGMFLQPAFKIQSAGTTVLLTPNYNTQQVDSLIKKGYTDLIALPETTPYKSSKSLPSYRALDDLPNNLFIVGEGISRYVEAYIENKSVAYLPIVDYPEGITSVLQEGYIANRAQAITGTFYNRKGEKQLVLNGPGGKEDSITFQSSGLHSFELKFRPKQAGNFSYNLTVQDSTQRYSETLPVVVRQEKPLSVLFLNSYPTAEVRFLKNQLAEKGHRVAVRYQVSTNRYQTEFINQQPINVERITRALLEEFDVIITDAQAYNALSKPENTYLLEEIKNGLGLLILADDSFTTNQPKNLPAFSFHNLKQDTAQFMLPSGKLILATTPARLSENENLYPVTQDANGHTLSGYVYYGSGKIIVQLLTHTYTLILQDKPTAYTDLWIPVIERTARNEKVGFKLTIKTPFPLYVDEPVVINIISAAEKPNLLLDSINIPVQEHPLIDNVWEATVRIPQAGWHNLTIAQDSTTLPFYAFAENEWASVQKTNQLQSMRKFATNKTGETDGHMIEKPVNPLWFYLLFLAGATVLWLIPRF